MLPLFKQYETLSFRLIASSGAGLPTGTIPLLMLAQDKTGSEEEALREVHAKVWTGDNFSLAEMREDILKICSSIPASSTILLKWVVFV